MSTTFFFSSQSVVMATSDEVSLLVLLCCSTQKDDKLVRKRSYLNNLFSFMQQSIVGGGCVIWYSHGDGEVSTLLFRSCEGDGESGLNPLRLIDELDPELVMVDWKIRSKKQPETK